MIIQKNEGNLTHIPMEKKKIPIFKAITAASVVLRKYAQKIIGNEITKTKIINPFANFTENKNAKQKSMILNRRVFLIPYLTGKVTFPDFESP